MKIRPISTANPVTDAATTFKDSNPDFVTDWTGFITSLGSAITAAGASLQGETLSSFANQIGYQSSTPSEQVQTLAATSGGVNRRAMLGDHGRQSTTRLSSYFTSLNLDYEASYGCSCSSD
jgi:alcohol dehydrogenase YqhD (iron-dependent ADH family)